MYKICSKCKEEKLFSQFSRHKNSKDGYTNQCKFCVKLYREKNKTKLSEQKREYYQLNIFKFKEYHIDNRDKILMIQKEYYKDNKNLIANVKREYCKNNRHKVNALVAKRRASKLNATPKWLTVEDLQNIQELYEIAQAFKLYTGQEYHVDHIIPLQGEKVCGLHVPWNLQILEASENIRKSNKLLDN